MKTRYAVLPFMLCLFAGPLLADIYRWVDANGHVVYSQTLPPDARQVKKIKTQTPTPASPASQEYQQENLDELIEELDQIREARLEKEAREKEQKRQKKQRKQRCATARKQLAELNNLPGYTSYWKTQNGYEMLTPELREQQRQKLHAVIEENCKK